MLLFPLLLLADYRTVGISFILGFKVSNVFLDDLQFKIYKDSHMHQFHTNILVEKSLKSPYFNLTL